MIYYIFYGIRYTKLKKGNSIFLLCLKNDFNTVVSSFEAEAAQTPLPGAGGDKLGRLLPSSYTVNSL